MTHTAPPTTLTARKGDSLPRECAAPPSQPRSRPAQSHATMMPVASSASWVVPAYAITAS